MPINQRLINLFIALRYESNHYENTGNHMLTKGQRICINQERAYLMQNGYYSDKNDFKQADIVNEKVFFILNQVHDKSDWHAHENQALEILNHY